MFFFLFFFFFECARKRSTIIDLQVNITFVVLTFAAFYQDSDTDEDISFAAGEADNNKDEFDFYD